ncbi:histidine kinase [Paenibacillus sp. HB172176]|uniref:sensor histidine kinase n=1 Tax=Paenibacillus sp. HB172176 TaxID=2493690 RepID=UPI0014395DC6|nr:histidine kinase [Paenibacillus sp. HB172176]
MIVRPTILGKLIVSLLLIVIPLYALNYMLNNLATGKNREEITATLQNSVKSYNNIVSGELIRIREMLDAFSRDVAVAHANTAVSGSDSALQAQLTDFRKDLNRIQYSSRFITDTVALLPQLQTTISSTKGMKSSVDQEEYASLNHYSTSFVTAGKQLFVSVPYDTRNSVRPIRFILAVNLSSSHIAAYLSQIMNFKGGGALYYSAGEEWEIATQERTGTAEQLKKELAAFDPTRGLAVPEVRTIRLNDEPYIVAYQRSSQLNTILAAYAPKAEIYQSLGVYRKWFYAMSAISVLIIMLCSLWLYKLIHKPLRNIVGAIRKVESGDLRFTIMHGGQDEFDYLYRRFNDMIGNLDKLVHVVADQKIANERSELKRLQSQINPHFLYNNFYVLQSLIRMKRIDRAGEFTGYLGQYFQFVTRQSADDIPLEEDIGHAKTYEEIQRFSFNGRIIVVFDTLPGDMARILVPRLIVQPIIENSYRHAFEHKLGAGRMSIQFEQGESISRIVIEDSGSAISDERIVELDKALRESAASAAETTGMINVHRRLRLKFGGQSGLRLSRSTLGGLKTEIVIDLKGGKQR